MNKLVAGLHDATHLVPGVPVHRETPATGRRHRAIRVSPRPHDRDPRPPSPDRHHEAAPRILISWQNWIARLVGHEHGHENEHG